MRILYLTSEWPTKDHYWAAPFLVRQVEHLRKAGIDVDVFPFRGRRNLLTYSSIYRNLHNKLRADNYDLVHAQFGQNGLLAALPKRKPLVVTFRGSEVYGIYTSKGRYTWFSPLLRLLMNLLSFAAEEIVVVSDNIGRMLWRNHYHIIPSGIDFELFHPMSQSDARQQLDLSSETRLVIFVGGPGDPVKRFHLAEASMALVDPSLNTQLIALTGIPSDQIPLYMNAADVLLVTSKHEGSPNSVKEALACNLPIVTLDVGDVRERLKHVSGCTIVPSEQPEDIARAIETTLRRRQRTNGWEAVQELDEALLAQKQIKVYEAALERSQRR